MPDFTVTNDAGQKYKIPGPEGATQEQAQAWFKEKHPDLYSPQRDFSGNVIPANSKSTMPKEALDPTFGTEFVRGAAGDIYGAGQLVGHVLPQSITDPFSQNRMGQQLKTFATAPTQGGFAGKVARFAGGAAPLMVAPELGLGAIGDAAVMGGVGGAIQPTESGSLQSHLGGAAAGTFLGGLGGSLGGTAAQEAMRKAGVRLTPGRIMPFIGKEWERFASHLPGLNRLIGQGRQVSLDDFQRVLYQDALEPFKNLGGAVAPKSVGADGLNELFTTITDRLNGILSKTKFTDTNGLAATIDTIRNRASGTGMGSESLNKLQSILDNNIFEPIVRNRGVLPGESLAGPQGIIPALRSIAQNEWRSGDKTLAATLDDVQKALLDHASVGGVGRAELDAARQAYARYITISRAGSGTTKEGYIEPQSLLSQLRSENPAMFARGGMRLQDLAQNARKAGVPTVKEADPEMGIVHSIAASLFHPAYYASVPPSLLYNRPGMSLANAAANQARRIGTGMGVAAGQADQSDLGAWIARQFGG